MSQSVLQKQTQALSAQTIETIKILQMDQQALTEYIKEAVQSNPVLDPDTIQSDTGCEDVQLRRIEWQHRAGHTLDEADESDFWSSIPAPDKSQTLRAYLLQQLPREKSGRVSAARFLIECLQDDGYLPEPLDALLPCSGFSLSQMQAGAALLRSLEPAGVGAEDLTDCLLLQLQRRSGDTELAARIVTECLPLVARGQYHRISQLFRCSQAKAEAACKIIRSLQPRPGASFGSQLQPAYLVPDVVVTTLENGELHAEVYTAGLGALRVDESYLCMLRDTRDPQLRAYLQENRQKAIWLIAAVQKRNQTLLHCVQVLCQVQKAFLTGSGPMQPYRLQTLAAQLDLHPSTVGRAMQNKYLKCIRGIFPLSDFFPAGAGTAETGEQISQQEVLERISRLIAQEDRRCPLSDQAIAEHLQESGYALARRTVAKYRTELGFPAASARRDRSI